MKCVAAVPLSIAVVFMASCATLRNALNFQEPQIQLQEISKLRNGEIIYRPMRGMPARIVD